MYIQNRLDSNKFKGFNALQYRRGLIGLKHAVNQYLYNLPMATI